MADKKTLTNALLYKATVGYKVPDEAEVKEAFYATNLGIYLTEENNQKAVELKWNSLLKTLHNDKNIIFVKDELFNQYYISKYPYVKIDDRGIVLQLVPVLKTNDGVFYRQSELGAYF